MFNHQFGLVAIAVLLLSSSLVQAREIDDDPSGSVGNVQIQTTQSETIIQTPKIQIITPKVRESKVLGSRTRRRSYTRTSTSATNRKPLSSHRQTISVPDLAPIRSSTIRRSNYDEDSQTSEQQQSVQCGGSGSSVSQSSTSTVNGRTVRSEVNRDCR